MKISPLVIWLLLSLLPVFFIPEARAQEPPRTTRELSEPDREPSESEEDIPAEEPGPSGPQELSFTLEDAILLALNRNRDLKVQIVNPKIAETAVEERKAPFDFSPFIKLQAEQTTDETSLNRKDIRKNVRDEYPNMPDDIFEQYYDEYFGDVQKATLDKETQSYGGVLGFSKLFSTGTKLEFDLGSQYSDEEKNQLIRKTDSPNEKSSTSSTRYSTSASMTLTQPLLQGVGRKVNLSLVRQAEFDQQISAYELQQYIIELVARVQKNYWDLVLAKETLNIREKSLELSERQMDETQERIRLGKQAESELIFAQAEVAAEKGKVIDAKSALSQRTLDFLRLLNPDVDTLWDRKVSLTTPPAPIDRETGNVQEHVATAFRSRPDLAQAYLNLQKGDLEVVRTRNGLLPRLDFFITLKNMASGPEFPQSISEFDDSDYIVGLNLSRPLENTQAKAQSRRAGLSRLKYLESIENLKQIIQVEVRKAIGEIERCREQIFALQANRSKQEEKLKVEQEKFRVGRSTNLLVFQAQRDLTEARVREVTAIIDQIEAFIDLQICEGTLLQQWSIETISPLLR
ncbi:MAG: TolC family protein [bacterium]